MAFKCALDRVYFIDGKTEYEVIVRGWCFSKSDVKYKLKARVNNQDVPCERQVIAKPEVYSFHPKYKTAQESGYRVVVRYSKDLPPLERFALYADDGQDKKTLVDLAISKLRTCCGTIDRQIESATETEGMITILGWGVSQIRPQLKICVVDELDSEVDAAIKRMVRKDVSNIYFGDESRVDCGFKVEFKGEEGKRYRLLLRDGQTMSSYPVSLQKVREKMEKESALSNRNMAWNKIRKVVTVGRVKKGFSYLVQNGPRSCYRKVKSLFAREEIDYSQWFENHKASEKELSMQRRKSFDYQPKISIIVPAYKTPENFLREMLSSVQNQTYTNWELCIGDGSADDDSVSKILESYTEQDPRIKYIKLEENKGISGNTNGALKLATGDFISLLDHDDLLAQSALYEIVEALNEDRSIDVLYTDEDKVSMDLKKHFDPHCKSDFNLDLLRSNNYICHFFVVKREIFEQAGNFRSEYDGSQDYDFILRCTELAKNIKHLPRILYHWRCHENSTAAKPESKMYCFTAGQRAIQAHLDRCKVEGDVRFTDHLGFYRVKYPVKGEPLVSILIPNKDQKDTLKKCIDSILNNTEYRNYEIIIIENNSVEQATFDYYKELSYNSKIRILYWKDAFNYSAINNYGVREARGEYLLLLNNDVEVIGGDWLTEMLGHCQRKEVGIVGAKLLYPDQTIQHAGIIMGLGGVAGHAYFGADKDEVGYFARAILQQDLSAVTAACLMVKRDVYNEVGGLEETLKVAFNDVDFCLKVRERGYLVVFTPYAVLYHYESKSRGKENTLEKIQRFENEINYMEEKWSKYIDNDPYYNPNLSLKKWDYSLRDNRFED